MDEPNLFRAWKAQVGVTNRRASELLGKSERRIEQYAAGSRPPDSVLLLMGVLAESRKPLRPYDGAAKE